MIINSHVHINTDEHYFFYNNYGIQRFLAEMDKSRIDFALPTLNPKLSIFRCPNDCSVHCPQMIGTANNNLNSCNCSNPQRHRVRIFEENGIAFYDGEISENAKRVVLDFYGNNFYIDGHYIGSIRTNRWAEDETHKGLSFDLESYGKFMAWTERSNDEESGYVSRLCYSRANTMFVKEGLHVNCNMYGHWHTLNNFYIGKIAVDGKVAYTGTIPIITGIRSIGDGAIEWTYSNLQVKNGIVMGYWT